MFRNCYFLVLLIGLAQCTLMADNSPKQVEKINGISLEASRQLIDSTALGAVSGLGAEWVALMPYAFVRKEEGTVHFNSSRQWIGERVDGIEKDIETCQTHGLKIMLKPHVWVGHGGYTGDYLPENGEWEPLETSFSNYILTFAQLAEDCHVELFCLGTEWRTFIKERPGYWATLIDSVRMVYSGKLTYAANWDEYLETPFWSELDYIGVNAYFPLSEKQNPTEEELKTAWEPIGLELSELSKITGKPVLFTEYGYRSVEGTTIKPWESYTSLPESMEEQKTAILSLYSSVWDKEWMVGGFLWKWHTQPPWWGKSRSTDYTPQEKPAEAVIRERYKN